MTFALNAQCDLNGVYISEILADPNGTNNFDTDGDGTAGTDDEFIEFTNSTGSPVDISGWTVYYEGSADQGLVMVTFGAETCIDGNASIVIINNWNTTNNPVPAGVFDFNGAIGNGGEVIVLCDNGTPNNCIKAVFNGQTGAIEPAGSTLLCTENFGSDSDGLSIQNDNAGNFVNATPNPAPAACTLPPACPDFSGIVAGDLAVVVTESMCNGFGGPGSTFVTSGTISAPATACPTDSSLEYSIDGGTTWSPILPTYDDSNAITIVTRCTCDDDGSMSSLESSVTTVPDICPFCPLMAEIMDVSVIVTDSECNTFGGTTGQDVSGTISPPLTMCPTQAGSTAQMEYSIDGGVTWSNVLPTYDDVNPTTILSRCTCVGDLSLNSITSSVTTSPGACPPCPDLSGIVAGDLAVTFTDSECATPSGTTGQDVPGGTTAPTTMCPAGSTLEYSIDGGTTWTTMLPAYDDDMELTIDTRCLCDNDPAVSSAVSSVTTVPGECPPEAACNSCNCAASPNSYTINTIAVNDGQMGYTLTYALTSPIANFSTDRPPSGVPVSFSGLPDNTAYEVCVFNVEDADLLGFEGALSSTNIADAIAGNAPFDAYCYETFCTIFPAESCQCCPDLSGIAVGDLNVGFTDSECNTFGGTTGQDVSGTTTAPTTMCPTGSSLEYFLDGGTTWTTTLPTYDDDNAITIDTRCVCDNDDTNVSAVSSITTDPGECPVCPDLTMIADGDLDVTFTDSVCNTPNGNTGQDSSGSTTAPTTMCPTGSTLEYSTDGGMSWGTMLPAYDDANAITIDTRCICDADATITSVVSSVTTDPGECPPCVDPVFTASSNSPICDGQDLVLTANTPTIGLAPFTWDWSFGGMSIATTQVHTIMNATASNAGTYTIALTDANGCASSLDVVVVVNPNPTLTVTQPDAICEGASVDLAMVDYAEMPTGGAFSYHSSQANADANNAPLMGTTISMTQDVFVRYEIATGCFATGVVSVVVNSNPIVVIADQTICADITTVDLTALEPVGQIGGAWTSGGAAVANSAAADPTTGPFTYTYTDANGCVGTDDVAYAINPLPVIDIADQAVCANSVIVSLVALEPAGQTGGIWTAGGAAVTNSAAADPTTGPFTYTFTDANGCVGMDDVSYSINPLPVIDIADQTICSNVTAFDLTSLEPLAAAGGTWFSGNNGVADPTMADPSSAPFLYIFFDVNGCSAVDGVDFIINPIPIFDIPDQSICGDINSVDLTALEPAGQAGGAWTNAAGAAIGTPTSVDPTTGPFIYTYTDGNGCVGSDTVTYNIDAVITVIASASCSNSTDLNEYFVEVTSVTGGDASGQYSVTVGAAASQIFTGTPLAFGPFTHSGTGTGTQTVSVDNNSGLSCPVTIEVVETLCGPSGVTCDCTADPSVGGEILSISEPGTFNTMGYAQIYVLVDASGNIISWNYTGQFSALVDGTYDVYAINVDQADQAAMEAGLTNGTAITGFIPDGTFMGLCYTISAPSNFIVACLPNEPVPTSVTICEDALPHTFTGPAGYTYLWSDGSTMQDFIATAAGTYTLTITNADGCEQDLVYELITNPLPNESTTPIVACSDAGLQTLTAPAGYTNLWFDMTTGATVQVNATGMYALTITDANGCTQDLVYAVTINDNPNEQETAPIIACEDSTPISLTAPSGYTYLWNDGSSSTTQSIDVTDSDVVGVTITDANGCTQLLVFDVTINSNPDEPAPAPIVVCEDELPVSLDGPAGFTYLWPDNSTNQIFDATAASTYDLTITDDSGCSQLLSYMVSVNPNPVLTDLNLLVCEDIAGGVLEATVDLSSLEPALGATGGTFTDSNGAVVPNPASVFITGTNPFDFTYTFTDVNACASTATVTYNVIQTPVNVDLSIDICEVDASGIDLTALEMQIGDTGGTWSDANGVLGDPTNVTASIGNSIFSYDVTDANGCGFTTAVTYNLFAGPVVTAAATCANSTDLNEYYIEVTSVTGSDLNSEYLVSAGANTVLFNGSPLSFGPFTHSGTGTATLPITVENANDPMCSSTVNVLETLCGPPTTCDCTLDPMPLTILAASEPGTFNSNGYTNYYVLIDGNSATGVVLSWNNTGLFSGLNSSYPYEVIAANVDDVDMAAFVAALSGASSTDLSGMGGAFNGLCYTTNVTPALFNVDCGCFLCPSLDSMTSSGPVCAGETFDLTANGTLFDMAGNGNDDFDVLFGYYTGSVVTTDPYLTEPTLFNGGAAVTPVSGSAMLMGIGATLAPGTYTVVAYLSPDPTLIDATCNPSIAVDVTVNSLPNESTPTPIVECADATPITLTAPAGYGYLWSDSGDLNQTLDVVVSGVYSVTLTDANGCQQVLDYDVTVNPLPSEPAPSPLTVCADTTPITLSAPAGYSYAWSDGSAIQDLDVVATGLYTVTLTDGNTCTQDLVYDVTVNDNPTEMAPMPMFACTGETIIFTGPAGYTYAWDTGETTSTIQVTTSGSYTLSIMDANGCTQDLVYAVTFTDAPTISAVATCAGSADLNEYFIDVDLMGSDTYDVTVAGVTQTYTGTTLSFGPITHSGSGLGTSAVTAVSQSNVNCQATVDVLEALCGPPTTCDCSLVPNPLSILASSQPGTFNTNGYTNVYVLTDANGVVIASNNTGLFNGLAQLTSYDVTAANVDDADLANFQAALSTATLTDILNMANGMVGLCYSTSTPQNFNEDCGCFVCDIPTITAAATCTGSTDQNEYYVEVDVTGTNTYDVEVAGVTQTYSGSTLTFGPFAHSGSGLGIQTVTAAAQMDAACINVVDVLETLCGPATSCDCTDPFSPLTILASSQPGTFNTDGYTNVYVLSDATGTVIASNNTGLFTGLAANTAYDVTAVNVDDAELAAFTAALAGANVSDLNAYGGGFAGLCYIASAPASFNEDCACGFYDLALTKVLSTPGPYFAGQNVTFTVTVFNQGAFDVTDVSIADYIPAGLIFNQGDNTTPPNDWVSVAAVTHTFPGTIATGASASVDIVLQIDPAAMNGVTLVNYAEIIDARDGAGNPIVDQDSSPGDNVGADETGTDNDIDDDSTGGVDNPNDNDDYDPAPVTITCPDVAVSDPGINLCSTDAGTVDLTLYNNTVNPIPGATINWYDGPPTTGTILSPATNVDLNTALGDNLYVEVIDPSGCSSFILVNVTIRNVGCGGTQFPWNGQ